MALAGGGIALTGTSAYLISQRSTRDGDKVDDWQYEPGSGQERAINVSRGGAAAQAQADSANIGLTAGGSADAKTFRRNVEEGYLPIPESITPEGIFHQYYFDTGNEGTCSSTFCPQYSTAVSPDPLSGESERFLTVGLDSGRSPRAFGRPRLNLVLALDISGSMSESFDGYYYDRYGNRREPEGDTDRSKIDAATDVLASLTNQLTAEDRLGIVLFNGDGHLAKPLRPVGETDMAAIREHIRTDIEAGGRTSLSAGLKQSEQLIAEYTSEAGSDVENRTILLTDAQINTGQTGEGTLRTRLASNAEEGHHTTTVGIGVDFNAELVDSVTSIRGANYYSVHSADEFERRLDEQFQYMVSPLVYDLSLELDAPGYRITRVYGSSAAEESSEELVSVNTLFPSPPSDGRTKGSVVLVGLERSRSEGDGVAEPTLTASWETRSGTQRSTKETVRLPGGDTEQYDGTAIRKAILLARYAELLTNWTIYEREQPTVAEGIEPLRTDGKLGQWEQRSEPLTVSPPYDSRLETFREHLASERERLGDEQLDQERSLLETILEARNEPQPRS
jgi:Ca-activated chloride channel family protein